MTARAAAEIDFSEYDYDMSEKAYTRLLSIFANKQIFQALIKAFIDVCPQTTYDSIIDEMQANTLASATGTNLDIIGRIVGIDRETYSYDESMWFCYDRPNQGYDSVPWWVEGADLATYEPADDFTYRTIIQSKIARNFNRFSSVPELLYYARLITSVNVSFVVVGPMEVEIIIPSLTPNNAVYFLTAKKSTTAADDIYYMPYPATMNLSRATFVPEDNAFIYDLPGDNAFDSGLFAITVPLR